MKTKTINLLTICVITMSFSSCNSTKTISEESKSNNTLILNEMVKTNAEKCFQFTSPADSINIVTTDISVIDSFTFKQNIGFRKNQINDSIKLANNGTKIRYYKEIIYLLDSIEKSLGQHVNDIISYEYKFIKNTISPNDTINADNKTTITTATNTMSAFFYTDATPTRQIILLPEERKDIILNPLEYPDYYKRIDRAGTTIEN
jgi:hypothetical protein